jgi:hypothetical protein
VIEPTASPFPTRSAPPEPPARLASVLPLYLAAVALLPWSTFPRFPWLHPHAQWSDAVFALAALAWLTALARERRLPRLRLAHAGMGLYLAAASASLAAAGAHDASDAAKLLGIAMLVMIAVVTGDLAADPRFRPALAHTVAATMLLTCAAALAGAVLWVADCPTVLVSHYGDLLPGAYPRIRAGFLHPNLLASFCVFAWGVIAHRDAGLSRGLRRATAAALAVTSLLTFSRGILALGLAVLLSRADTPFRRALATTAAGLLVAILAALTWYNVSVDPTHPAAAHLGEGPSSRWQTATSSWSTLVAHPWLGIGPGRSPGMKDGAPFDAHCTPLNVAATLGWPALFGLAIAVIGLWRSRARPTDRATWAMLLALAIDGLASDIEDFRHVWIALGLAGAPVGTANAEARPA